MSEFACKDFMSTSAVVGGHFIGFSLLSSFRVGVDCRFDLLYTSFILYS